MNTAPYEVRHAAVNAWTMPWSITDHWFDKHYLLHWDGLYLAEKVNNGTLEHDGVKYKINWIAVPTLCYAAKQVKLSFRRIRSQSEGYVLIKVQGGQYGCS